MEKWWNRLQPLAAVAVVIGGVWWTGRGVTTEVKLLANDLDVVRSERVVEADTQSRILKSALEPVTQSQKRLENKLEIVESNVNGMSIAATDGAASRDRLLSGKITAVQQTMVEVKDTQQAFIDTLTAVQGELSDIQRRLDTPPDTVVVTLTDTLKAPGKRSILNPVGWIFGRDKED